MNFNDLLTKMKELDEGYAAPIAPTKDDVQGGAGASDEGVAECGDMMPAKQGQQDNVSISINMNGQGAGGIKDLMAVLRDIENGSSDGNVLVGEPGQSSEEEPIMGNIVADMEGVEPPVHYGGQGPEGAKFDLYMQQRKDQLAAQKPVGEEFGNSAPGGSGQVTKGISAVTPTGDDLASKGQSSPRKVNGGENPMHESLVNHLTKLYAEVKSR